MEELTVGTRVEHPRYGEGIISKNINSHTGLSDEDKVNLQQYITRIYGSLTTFNILFSEKEHYFVGAKSK